MVEKVPLFPALGIATLLCACGLLVAVVTRRAADGRLRPNALAGIRTSATLRSDEAWRAGHLAAVPLSDAGGVAWAVSGLLGLVLRSAPVFAGVLLSGVIFGGVLMLLAARQAIRAASSAP